MSVAVIGELRFCSQCAVKHALLLCISLIFLFSLLSSFLYFLCCSAVEVGSRKCSVVWGTSPAAIKFGTFHSCTVMHVRLQQF